MRVTRATQYAVHALVFMAARKDAGLVTSGVIAREVDLPEEFLLRVLTQLMWAGILRSVKGPHGGFHLTRSPAEVSLLEVIEAVEGSLEEKAIVPEMKGGAA